MDLKQRKRIKNTLPKYDIGKPNTWNFSTNSSDPLGLNSKLISKPTNDEIASIKAPSIGGQADAPQTGGSAPDVGGAIGGAVNFAGSAMEAFGPVKGTSELLAESGTDTNSTMGVSYNTQNGVNTGEQLDNLKKETTSNTLKTAAAGASVGMCFGPIGAAAGLVVGTAVGLIGGAARKRKLKKRIAAANRMATDNNIINRSGAMTTGLQNQFNQQFGNTQDDILYA